MKSVCLFGIYDPGYARTKVLKRAYEQNGYLVAECNVDPRKYKGVSKYVALLRAWNGIAHKDFEHILVGFPGHSVVWLARLVTRKFIVFDAFLSLYDSNTADRRLYSRLHIFAWYDWLLDYSSCLLSHKILLDTEEHIKYFNSKFGVPIRKCIRVPIGADEGVFFPTDVEMPLTPLIVHFHGMYIPLQGLRYIVEAALILKDVDVTFRIVGNGQEYELISDMVKKYELKNVHLVGRVDIEEVSRYVARSHVCLGIFGDTEKSLRVIPNKVYEYAAMGKAIITADSPAIREEFSNQSDVLLCTPANGEAIADAILKLSRDIGLRERIGRGARDLFLSRFSAKVIGKEFIKHINER